MQQTESSTEHKNLWRSVEEALREIDKCSRESRHFIVLGAGMAGLAAAYELQRRGHTVEVLEGSSRVGGRVLTHYFPSGQYGELGAMRIPTSHDYTMHYVRELRLETRPFYNEDSNRRAFYDVGGRHVPVGQPGELEPAFPGLTPAEKQQLGTGGPGSFFGTVLKEVRESLSPGEEQALMEGRLDTENLKRLDRLSVRACLEEKCSPAVVALIGSALGIESLWQWSMAAFLRDELAKPGGKLEEIIGGLSLLPQRLAARLGSGTIRFGVEVRGLTRDAEGKRALLLKDAQGEHRRELRAKEYVLCTLPFPVLRRMDHLEALPTDKRRAIRNMQYASSTKVLLHCRRRFWESARYGIFGGRSVSDRLSRHTYYPSDNVAPSPTERLEAPQQPAFRSILDMPEASRAGSLDSTRAAQGLSEEVSRGPGVLLGSYSWNDNARALGMLKPEERVEQVTRCLSHFHPELQEEKELVDAAASIFWDEYRWSRGAFAITPPGDLGEYYQVGVRPEPPFFFAGEHLSIAPGWIQGAIQSSLRAVVEMLQHEPQQ